MKTASNEPQIDPPGQSSRVPAGREPGKRTGRRKLRTVTTCLAILFSLGLVAYAAGFASGYLDWPWSSRHAPHPQRWDPRVAALAGFVEEHRGLEFEHPVFVDFMTAGEYSKANRPDPADLTDADRIDNAAYNAFFHSLGLIERSADVSEAYDDLTGEGTDGVYDPETERIAVQGTELTVGTKITLVHELTHALQDQHFDIDRGDEFSSDGEEVAFTAVVEGDAVRIENFYISTLSDEVAEAYFADQEKQPPSPVPLALDAFFGAPYALGEQLVYFQSALGSDEAVDRLFVTPPDTEEHLVDPFAFREGQKAEEVDIPKIKKGEKELTSGDFGSVAWLVLLSQYMDPRTALRAVDGWGGDAFVTFSRGKDVCTRALFKGDSGREAGEMRSALEQWKASSPWAREVVAKPGSVQIESCSAPGIPPSLDEEHDPFAAPYARTGVAADLIAAGAPPATARCVAQAVVDRLPMGELINALEKGLGQGAGQGQVDLVAGQCSSKPLPKIEEETPRSEQAPVG